MAARPRNIKHFGDLRLHDFRRYPVWVCCHIEDVRESWYHDLDDDSSRPWTGKLPIEAENQFRIVRTKFVLADSTRLEGFTSPEPLAKSPQLWISQPRILLADGTMIDFWYGAVPPTLSDFNRLYRLLKKAPRDVFPINYEQFPGLALGRSSGTLSGLSWIRRTRRGNLPRNFATITRAQFRETKSARNS